MLDFKNHNKIFGNLTLLYIYKNMYCILYIKSKLLFTWNEPEKFYKSGELVVVEITRRVFGYRSPIYTVNVALIQGYSTCIPKCFSEWPLKTRHRKACLCPDLTRHSCQKQHHKAKHHNISLLSSLYSSLISVQVLEDTFELPLLVAHMYLPCHREAASSGITGWGNEWLALLYWHCVAGTAKGHYIVT